MTQQDLLTERYGAPSAGRRRLLVIGTVVLAAVFLGWLGWTALAHADPEARSALVTYEVLDEHTATARVEVRTTDASIEATCLLRAYAEDHTVVGEKSFAASGTDAADGATYDQEVRTERLATSVELVGCTTPSQSRPR